MDIRWRRYTSSSAPAGCLRDGGGSADEDEAFTLVEAAIQDLPAALREIARLRAALDAAAAAPAATPLAMPAPEPAAAPAAPAPAPEPMEAEPTAPAAEPAPEPAPEPAAEPAPEPAADDAHEAEDAPLAVDAVAALAGAADLEAASLTHTDDGSRFLLRWRGGGASCVRVEDGAWRVVDVAGAATAEARVGRALALAAALAAADDVPPVRASTAPWRRSSAAPRRPLPSDAVEDAGDDDDSAGDFDDDDEAAPGTAMLVEGDPRVRRRGVALRRRERRRRRRRDPGRAVRRGTARGRGWEKFDVTSMRWDGRVAPRRRGGGRRVDAATRLKWEVRVDVVATARDVVLRASTSDGPVVYGVAALPVLKLLEAAAAAPSSIARDAAVTGAAAALAPRDIANVLLHAVATALSPHAFCLRRPPRADHERRVGRRGQRRRRRCHSSRRGRRQRARDVGGGEPGPSGRSRSRRSAPAAAHAGGPAFRRRTRGRPQAMPEPARARAPEAGPHAGRRGRRRSAGPGAGAGAGARAGAAEGGRRRAAHDRRKKPPC